MLQTLRRLAKRLLAVGWVRRGKESTERVVAEAFGSSRVLSHAYHTGAAWTFNREQYAVLRGRRDYYRNQQRDRVSHVELRRNVHRLEKGLIMRPRRDVFARDYIDETLDFYERAIEQYEQDPDSLDIGELAWARDVLHEFFKVVGTHDPVVDRARTRYERLPLPAGEATDKIPYVKADAPQAEVSYDDMVALSMQRRSVRWFDDRPVDRDLVDRALEVARQAPTACNRLPYEFRIFDDPEMVAKVASLPFGTAGYSHNIPTIVVVVGKLDSYFSSSDRHGIYIDSSLAVMSFLFALETLGLSSSVINWPDFEPLERKMQKALGLESSDRVTMLVALGYAHPDGMVPYSQKKALDTFRSWNVLP